VFNKLISVPIALLLFCSFSFAQAELMINEIMYDLKTGTDDGREWVEIFNAGNMPVDLTSYRFFEADTNHRLVLFQGNPNIEAQGYAVIASNPVKFKADWPSFSGAIFDSAFSLGNSGETLALKNKDLNIVDQYVYVASLGAKGDGRSLQKILGSWVAATPTPGAENKNIKPVQLPVKLETSKASTLAKTIQPKSETKIVNVVDNNISLIESVTEDLSEEMLEDNMVTNENQSGGFKYSVLGLIALLATGAGGAYFIRRYNRKPVAEMPGDDFEILE